MMTEVPGRAVTPFGQSSGDRSPVFGTHPRPLWEKAVRKIARAVYRLRWKIARPDFARRHRVRVGPYDYIVEPTVFHPRWHLTSEFLAGNLSRLPLGPGTRVLDIGTGSGILAMSAAALGCSVKAVDVNSAAVACAGANVRRAALNGNIAVVEGDMFSPVQGERFNFVLCNPPYFKGKPRSVAEQAYYAGENYEWIRRFAREAQRHITRGGAVVMVFGDAADVQTLVRLIEAEGWQGEVFAQRDLLFEVLTAWKFILPAGDGEAD